MMGLIKISVSDDFQVDYDKERGMYRVSVFEDGHFWDEHWFDAYEEKEVDNRIEKIIDKLQQLKVKFKERLTKRMCLDAKGVEYFLDLLINWIKDLK